MISTLFIWYHYYIEGVDIITYISKEFIDRNSEACGIYVWEIKTNDVYNKQL